jgi:glyoxylase-like metal-dependent hydrolase (beta-lactamase superfamily II)
MSATNNVVRPIVKAFLDHDSETFSYVVYDHQGGHAAIIDPVLDYDPKSGRTRTDSAQQLLDFVAANRLTVDWILETHAHADHLSAAPFIRDKVGGKIAIGEKIVEVQKIFRDVFNLEKQFLVDGSQFDKLFAEGETFQIGSMDGEVIYTPGHTPADMSWRIGDALFVGDTIFMPDVGTARCDFPGGDAATLYQSVQRLLALPEATRMFMCHDYPTGGREHLYETTVAEQKKSNIHVHDGVTQEQFVAMREARDATLEMPRLILPSIQLNIRAGQMPPAEDNGTVYFKIPVNKL